MIRHPLSKRTRPDPDPDWEGPFDGVPDWLTNSVEEWIRPVLLRPDMYGQVQATSALQSLQRQLRLTLPWGNGAVEAYRSLVEHQCLSNRELFLDVLNWCVEHESDWDRLANLEVMLMEGGSIWSVGRTHDGTFELQRRLDSTTADLIRSADPGGGRPAEHLARAWSAIYGREPSPSQGYREAVRAVESAASVVIAGNDSHTTLGKPIADMKMKPSKWTTCFNPPEAVDDIGQVIGMMELLWKSQLDRHGSADSSVPLSVSQEEAEAALHLSATLVHWFTSRAVRRTDL